MDSQYGCFWNPDVIKRKTTRIIVPSPTSSMRAILLLMNNNRYRYQLSHNLDVFIQFCWKKIKFMPDYYFFDYSFSKRRKFQKFRTYSELASNFILVFVEKRKELPILEYDIIKRRKVCT